MNISSLTSFLVGAIWFIVFITFGVVILRASRNQPTRGSGRVLTAMILFAVLLTTLNAGLVFIEPQERGVVISAVSPEGYRKEPLEPGLRFIIPFAEQVVRYSIANQTYTMSIAAREGQIEGDDSIAARTEDGQEIYVDASVIYAINPTEVVKVHILWQNRYTSDLVRPLARGIIRDAVSQMRVDEVVSSKRAELVQTLNETMALKLAANGLILKDFVLRNITFSPEYAASVEQKQIAEQQAQQAKFVVEQKKQEAEQARQVAQGQADAAVIRAKGEAEARLIQAEAEAKALEYIANVIKNNPDILNYQYITKLAPNVQVIMTPSNTPIILPYPGSLQAPAPTQPTTPQ
ncbi:MULTISPECIES: prohibitin family protein [Anaerolinea]|uniref:prohibitin family protein n=1 Tax=Anaerolinea TaxID=233189 RepID=UPI0026127212|nr:prohibitin family protein [Anaerolinea thermophila]